MAILGGKKVQLNSGSAATKAEQLNSLAKQIASKIYEVDGSITNLVKVGIEGTAVATAATTYKANRDVISVFVAQLANTAVTMKTYADAVSNINLKSEDAASSVSK
ncbi:MAG: hypothetical protein K5776_12415 [Lachnospiraceae bacterium]|nr:hypothetical protein [Lachnospiraceae bacterium]